MIRLIWMICFNSIILDLVKYRYLSDKSHILQKIGRKLVILLPKLGPAFIKFGQSLATRPDLIGEELSKELQRLQDKMDACPFVLIKEYIYKAINDKQLISIDETAIAAASISQVHKAVMQSGEIIALKVLRPGIHKKFARNLSVLGKIAYFINIFSGARRLKLPAVVEKLRNITAVELNLMMEAASADQLRVNMQHDKNVYVPKIYWEYTTQNVLAMEWVDGIGIYNKEQLLSAGFDLQKLTQNLAVAFFNQAYRDGFFHADLHQGNILVNQRGQVVFLDFGIMGYLDYKNKIFIAEILKGFISRDYELVARLHFAAGYVPNGQSQELFAIACRSIGEPIFNRPAEEISVSQLLGHLFTITQSFQMQTQPQLLLLQKTMVMVEGISMMLDNKVNMWLLITPWIEQWAKENLGIKKTLNEIKYSYGNMLYKINTCLDLLEKRLKS